MLRRTSGGLTGNRLGQAASSKILVDGTPEILLLPLDLHEEFVQVPRVTHAASPPSPRARVLSSERLTPCSNRLVRHGDAPLGQKVFGVPEAQAEPVVQPDRVTDDLGRKSVSVVAGGLGDDQPTLPGAVST